jgi:hypothetical protein
MCNVSLFSKLNKKIAIPHTTSTANPSHAHTTHFTKLATHESAGSRKLSSLPYVVLICVGPVASYASSALLPLFCCTAPLSFLVFALPPAFRSPRLVRMPRPTKAPLLQPKSCLYFLLFCFCPVFLVGGQAFDRVVVFPFSTNCKQMRLVCAFIVGVLSTLTCVRARDLCFIHVAKETKQACRACRSS